MGWGDRAQVWQAPEGWVSGCGIWCWLWVCTFLGLRAWT